MSTFHLADVRCLSGVPFVHAKFAARLLASGVVAVRQMHGRTLRAPGLPDEDDVQAWLQPAVAVKTRPGCTPIPSRPLPQGKDARVALAVERICRFVPQWKGLMRLPVVYHLLEQGSRSLSASSYLWPQQILLSEAAFESDEVLADLVLHEMCHQWLYLIEELWPFDKPGARRVTLPSGTENRAPREVIGAAHVAAVTVHLHRATGMPGTRTARFTEYGKGCVALLDRVNDDLTPAGRIIAHDLKEAL
ncbi:aKG-HExxH-type peptide beta-hydroxylase [Streptomyces tsukubensis]|uniref:aKG-HExxH-type peptide beta-hydroxylase n=1 Tax=Streptomyces tsukubensis TaxID=83656 RepID=UPI00344B0196